MNEFLAAETPGTTTMTQLLVLIFIGITAAAIYAFYYKKTLGAFIRKLMEIGADSPESAKTLEELGYDKSGFWKRMLKEGGQLSRHVGKNELGGYYITPENYDMMQLRYDDKGTNIWTLLLTIGASALLMVGLYFLIPLLLDYLNTAFI